MCISICPIPGPSKVPQVRYVTRTADYGPYRFISKKTNRAGRYGLKKLRAFGFVGTVYALVSYLPLIIDALWYQANA